MSDNRPKNRFKPSLARHATTVRLRTLIISLSWYAAWALGYMGYTLKYGKYWLFEFYYIGIIIFTAILLMPFAVLQLHNVLMDSNWEGIVLDKRLRYYDVYDRGESVTARFGKEKVIIMCETDKGAIKTFALHGELSINADYYSKGDRVRHHKGFIFCEKLDKSSDKQAICLKCGRLSDMHKDTCFNCGLELQK